MTNVEQYVHLHNALIKLRQTGPISVEIEETLIGLGQDMWDEMTESEAAQAREAAKTLTTNLQRDRPETPPQSQSHLLANLQRVVADAVRDIATSEAKIHVRAEITAIVIFIQQHADRENQEATESGISEQSKILHESRAEALGVLADLIMNNKHREPWPRLSRPPESP